MGAEIFTTPTEAAERERLRQEQQNGLQNPNEGSPEQGPPGNNRPGELSMLLSE